MGAISDISSILLQLYKLWQEHRGELIVTPAELYDKYVQPSYRLLKEVHSDYEDLYLELSERVHRDGSITRETVDWFTRARTRRAVDRSELTLFELPKLSGRTEKIADINAENILYIAAVQQYFRPESWSRQLFDKRIDDLMGQPTASSVTEVKLVYLHVCSQLDIADRRVLEAEREAESLKTMSDELGDQIIHTVLEAVNGHISHEVQQHLEALSGELHDASENVPFKHRFRFSGPNLERFKWREVLNEHIWAQRNALSRAIKEVQVRHVRLRILADR